MDLKEMMMTDGSGGPWTEEKHNSFLNWMEESFVRRSLGFGSDDDRFPLTCASVSRRPHLDRCLPDSATESTRDSRNPRTGRRAKSPADPGTEKLGLTSHDRTSKRPFPRSNVSQDQVVPQL